MTTVSNPYGGLPGNAVQGIVASIVVLNSLGDGAGRTCVCFVKEKMEWLDKGEVGTCDVSSGNCPGGRDSERNWDRMERSRILCFVFCERGSVCYFRLEMEGKQLTEDNRTVLMEERKAKKS